MKKDKMNNNVANKKVLQRMKEKQNFTGCECEKKRKLDWTFTEKRVSYVQCYWRKNTSGEYWLQLSQGTVVTVAITAKLYWFWNSVQRKKDEVCIFEQVSVIGSSLKWVFMFDFIQ